MGRELIALLARHGETTLNVDNCFRSRLDPELNENGVREAERLAEVVSKKYNVYRIISSPMLRAIQTADVIAESVGTKVEQDRGLMPWSLGFLAGKDKELYDHILQYYIDNPKQEIPDGESLDSFEERVEEFFHKVLRANYSDAPTGTLEGGYDEHGPYHCGACIHKTAKNAPYCIHPEILNSAQLKDKIVKINGRRAVPINLEKGCCEYVKPKKDTDSRIQLFISHTSVLVTLENLIKDNRDGRPEAGQEAVGPGGLAEIYSTDDGYEIVPVLEDKPAKFGE